MTRRTAKYIRFKACTGKRKYWGKREAQRAAQSATDRTGKRHRAYKCDYADHWHVTHVLKATFEYYERTRR